jgi:hypothetical protein
VVDPIIPAGECATPWLPGHGRKRFDRLLYQPFNRGPPFDDTAVVRTYPIDSAVCEHPLDIPRQRAVIDPAQPVELDAEKGGNPLRREILIARHHDAGGIRARLRQEAPAIGTEQRARRRLVEPKGRQNHEACPQHLQPQLTNLICLARLEKGKGDRRQRLDLCVEARLVDQLKKIDRAQVPATVYGIELKFVHDPGKVQDRVQFPPRHHEPALLGPGHNLAQPAAHLIADRGDPTVEQNELSCVVQRVALERHPTRDLCGNPGPALLRRKHASDCVNVTRYLNNWIVPNAGRGTPGYLMDVHAFSSP